MPPRPGRPPFEPPAKSSLLEQDEHDQRDRAARRKQFPEQPPLSPLTTTITRPNPPGGTTESTPNQAGRSCQTPSTPIFANRFESAPVRLQIRPEMKTRRG